MPDVHMVRVYVGVPAENKNATRVKMNVVAVAPSIQSTKGGKEMPRCRAGEHGKTEKKEIDEQVRQDERREDGHSA